MKRLLVLLICCLCFGPTLAWAQTTWSINPTTGTVILDNVTITDPLMDLGVTVDLKLEKQATGGAAQCLQVGTTGIVTATGSACGGAGSSPGGANTNVQYNATGSFAGDTSFTFNSGSKLVTVFDLLIADQATGGAAQCLQIDTAGNVTKTGSACSSSAGTVTHTGALTLHAPIIGNGTADIKATAAMTNGQVLIGSTGADPVPGAIGTSTLTATTGAGTFALDLPTIATHQLVIGRGAAPYVGLGSLGSTVTVLHGNAAGDPTFGAVNANTDLTGVVPVPNGGTGISSGTTGAIPYYTSTTTMASSAALTNHAVVIGGGSAQAPHTIVTGTSGQFLQSAGSGADPTWASAPALGTAATGNLTYWSSATAVAGEPTILNATGFGFSTGASGATNRTALQSAHDALPATGGTVICPAGAYAITGTVTITKSVTWTGPCALTEATSSATIFAVQTTALNVFDGMYLTNATSGAAITLDGVLGAAAWNSGTTYVPGNMVVSAGIPYTSLTTNTNHVPASNPSDWFVNSNSSTVIKGLTIVGGAYGVRTIRASAWFFGPNNSFFGQTTSAILVTNLGNQDGGDSTIFSNFILPAAGANGITWEGSGGTRIENNKVFAASSASPCAASIVIQPASGTATQAVQVVGNNLSNCNYGLLTQVVGGGSLQRLLISDNIIDGGLNAVNLSNSSVLEIIVSNNIMATGAAETLINVALASDVTLVGNQLKGFGVSNTFGIDIAATTARVMVGPNNFSLLTSAVRDSGTNTLYTGGGTVFAIATLPGTAVTGSNVYCNDCRGSQDAAYAPGACVSSGAHTGSKATFQGSAWQC